MTRSNKVYCLTPSGTLKPGIGSLRKNDLKQFGYSTSVPEARRHSALGKAVKTYGALSVFRKLNAVYVYSKNRAPAASAVFKMDRDWVKRQYDV